MDGTGSWNRFKEQEEDAKKGQKPILKGVIEDYKGKTYVSLWATDSFGIYIKKVLGVKDE